MADSYKNHWFFVTIVAVNAFTISARFSGLHSTLYFASVTKVDSVPSLNIGLSFVEPESLSVIYVLLNIRLQELFI